jgi:hypothetical protein
MAKPNSGCLCFNKLIFLYYIKYYKILICILHSNVYEPPLYLKGGGGVYSGRLKYNVLKKCIWRERIHQAVCMWIYSAGGGGCTVKKPKRALPRFTYWSGQYKVTLLEKVSCIAGRFKSAQSVFGFNQLSFTTSFQS